MKPAAATELEVRTYRDDDEPLVLELLRSTRETESHARWRPEFFRWKHLASPFGASVVLVAETDGRMVGLRAFMRWRFRVAGRTVAAVRSVDSATHSEYRRTGIFSTLTRAALDIVRDDAELVFNTPNQVAEPGYLKLGWRVVGNVPVLVRIRRPLRFLMGLHSVRSPAPPLPRPEVRAETARDVLDEGGIPKLLEAAAVSGSGLSTSRELDYLRWRYASPPGLDYWAVSERDGSQLSGLAIFRVRHRGRLREATVAELIVRPRDDRVARALLRRVIETTDVDHLSCAFAPGSTGARAARSCGFIPTGRGITLTVKPLREVDPDPADLRSWALSLGDLEVL